MGFMSVVARLAFAALVVAAIAGLVASFGTSLHFWDYRFGLFKLFPICLGAGFVALAFGFVWAATAFFSGSSEGARYGVVGFVGAILLLLVPVYDIAIGYSEPPIHDISTDTEYPPQFSALLTQRPGAENGPDYDGAKIVAMAGRSYTTTALQKKYYGDIHPIAILTTPEKLFARALSAAKKMGWNIVAVAPDEGRIEATDTTFFFGFTDDIVIRVRPSGMGARIDIRSKARDGQSDAGRDAARIRAYIKKLASS